MSQLEYYDYILVTLCSGMDLLGVNHLRGIFYITFSEPVARTKERGEKGTKRGKEGEIKKRKREGRKERRRQRKISNIYFLFNAKCFTHTFSLKCSQ